MELIPEADSGEEHGNAQRILLWEIQCWCNENSELSSGCMLIYYLGRVEKIIITLLSHQSVSTYENWLITITSGQDRRDPRSAPFSFHEWSCRD